MSTSFTIINDDIDGGPYDGYIPQISESNLTITFSNGLGDSVSTDSVLPFATNYGSTTGTFTDTVNNVTEYLYSVSDGDPTSPTYFTLLVVENDDGDIMAIEVGTTTENPSSNPNSYPTDGNGIVFPNTIGIDLNNLTDYNSLLVGSNDFSSGDYTYLSPVEEPEEPAGGEGGEGGEGVPCLTQTCNVLTPNGYQNVSSLKEGDIVTTSDGRNVAIQQLLTSKVNAARITPRVIKANAYGKNTPIVDTHLSDNHAYQVNGVWKLPKNEKLTQQWNEKYVTYYHLKLPNYTQDFLVVNGMKMEGWDGLTPKEFRPYMWVKHGKGVVLKHL